MPTLTLGQQATFIHGGSHRVKLICSYCHEVNNLLSLVRLRKGDHGVLTSGTSSVSLDLPACERTAIERCSEKSSRVFHAVTGRRFVMSGVVDLDELVSYVSLD